MDVTAASSPDEYCRAIEAYLCRKNDGHLIRIVGPSFEKVCRWAEQGIPLKAAFRGIDRYFERYYAKGPRRRPVRIDFCEADVLDVFDEWRRAVGLSRAESSGVAVEAPPRERHESLPAHLDRAIARLTALRGGGQQDLGDVVDGIVRELDGIRGSARGLRGTAREAVLARLAELDAYLVATARGRLTDQARQALRREAESELSPFRARMPQAAFEQSLAACADRLLREQARLPVLAFE